MRVNVCVPVDIEVITGDPKSHIAAKLVASAVEAVNNAVQDRQERGFSHRLSGKTRVTAGGAVAIGEENMPPVMAESTAWLVIGEDALGFEHKLMPSPDGSVLIVSDKPIVARQNARNSVSISVVREPDPAPVTVDRKTADLKY